MKTVQIRNVPEHLHRQLKARAAMEGRSLSEMALAELSRSLERPTLSELAERVRLRTSVETGESAADALHAGRAYR